MPKRKRASVNPREDNTERRASSASQTTESSSGVQLAEQKFSIVVHPYSVTQNEEPKRAPSHGNRTVILKQGQFVKNGPRCGYQVSPADEWNSLKKYNKFVVQDTNFSIGDFVYIYHGNQQQATGVDAVIADYWVAQVLEVRALDAAHVYLRVFWLYWPEDLPKGRQWYHGKHELIHSTDMQILDAMTVTAGAEVKHWTEKEPAPVDEMYWRQTLDYIKKTLSILQQYCYCKGYDGTDTMLIQCPHCNTDLHEQCLLRDARSRVWKQKKEKAAASAVDQQLEREASGTPKIIRSTIPDSQRSNGTISEASWSQLPPPPSPPIYSKPVTSTKRRKGAHPNKEQWEENTEGELQFKIAQGVETTEASGWATVKIDPVDEPSQTMTVGLRCLMPGCGRWIYDESAFESIAFPNHASQEVNIMQSTKKSSLAQSEKSDEQDTDHNREPQIFQEEADEDLFVGQSPEPEPEPGDQAFLKSSSSDEVEDETLVGALDSAKPRVRAQSASQSVTTNNISTPRKTAIKQEYMDIHRTIDDSNEEVALSSGIEFLSQEVQKVTQSSIVSGFNRVLQAFKAESPRAVSVGSVKNEP